MRSFAFHALYPQNNSGGKNVCRRVITVLRFAITKESPSAEGEALPAHWPRRLINAPGPISTPVPLAKRMGLPVGKLVCASNKNNILTDFIRTGVYDKRREFFKTMSPSMDILISSNLERLLFELADRNAVRVKIRMEKLANEGVYEIYDEEKEAIRDLFYADFCGEDETVETIYEFFEEYQYPMDTHTACAMYAASNYMAENKKDGAPMVVVSTASPYKFPQDVMYAITGNDIKDSFKAIKHLNIATAMKVPASLSKLRDKPVRFTAVADKDKLYPEVLKFIDRK